jgi:hypothetical protein
MATMRAAHCRATDFIWIIFPAAIDNRNNSPLKSEKWRNKEKKESWK